MPALPKITICPDGVVRAGVYTLEPSAKNWKRRRCWWRCRIGGKVVTGYCLTPNLALMEAVRKSTVGH